MEHILVFLRFAVRGFKNLKDVQIHGAPLMAIAGPNGAGKSNLLEALCLLSGLATDTIREAFARVRGDAFQGDTLEFEVDFLVNAAGRDELGQPASAAATFLRYELKLRLHSQAIQIKSEALSSPKGARQQLANFGSLPWIDSVLTGNEPLALIRTNVDNDATHLLLDGKKERQNGFQTSAMKRTVLSTCSQVAHHPTAFLAREALSRVRLFHLEPSALRKPDSLDEDQAMDTLGRHMPASLLRLAKGDPSQSVRVANTLATIVDGVKSVEAQENSATKTVEARLTDIQNREFPASAISDGTLRVLALAILLHDPQAVGTFLLEEPENGVHPSQLPPLLKLLRDIACDTEMPVDETNPLRQVCFTTHSPGLVGLLRPAEVLFASRRGSNLGPVTFLPVLGDAPSRIPDHQVWSFLREGLSEEEGTLAERADEFVKFLTQ